MPLSPGISAVVPVYNSQGTLGDLIARLQPVLSNLAPDGFEVILINDGSRDRSWQVVGELADKYPFVRGINMMRNYGQHNALLCGIRAARFDKCVTLDDDLQNPPEEIPKLLAKLDEGFDVVYGKPVELQHGLWRNLASQVTKIALQKAMGSATARNCSAFRAIRTELRQAWTDYKSPFVSIEVLLTWATTRFTFTPVKHDPRTVGQSNYTFRKLLTHALNMATGFSTWPLQLASMIGFAFFLFGMALLVFVIVRHFTSKAGVTGFAFLASSIALFSGAQLFALGIIGEYLARIHFRTMERPAYAIREETECGNLHRATGAREEKDVIQE
jgi:undecaprenyl-phosphate 4-deoxy-4-formamido-L-arabinose transferase